MRLLKKILRIIAIILPAFAAVMISHSTYAKSYTIDKIPFGVESKLNWPNFRIRYSYDDSLITTNDIKPKDLLYYYNKFEDGKCKFDSWTHARSFDTRGLQYDFFYYIPDFLLYYSDSDRAACNYLGARYKSLEFPAYTFGTPNFVAWNGYRYQYDGLYMSDCDPDLSTRCSEFDLTDLFTPLPDHYTEFQLPLGMPSSSVETLAVNTPIRLQGSFFLDSKTGSYTDFSFAPDTFQVRLEGFTSEEDLQQNRKSLYNFPCTFTHTTSTAEENAGVEIIEYICQGVSPFSYLNNYYYMNLQMIGEHLLDAPDTRMFIFEPMYLIYNNDQTPGGSFTGSVEGGEKQSSPNSILSPENDPGGAVYRDSWEYKLSHLFDFQMFNPFAPIFNMFSDQSECHHIPTLASWLKVEDDTYCPWFPAMVRNVTTPIIGIASTMLLFGFFVRFLKSSSGNDTIDSGGRNLEVKK